MSTILQNLSEIISGTIREVYLHPVTFDLKFDNLNADSFEDLELDQELINGLDWDICIDGKNITRATGKSYQNGNKDPRGGGCGWLNIPKKDFVYTIKNSKGITIRDITEIAYRLKGSKYDWWYESFSKLKVGKMENGHLEFVMEFDYGS